MLHRGDHTLRGPLNRRSQKNDLIVPHDDEVALSLNQDLHQVPDEMSKQVRTKDLKDTKDGIRGLKSTMISGIASLLLSCRCEKDSCRTPWAVQRCLLQTIHYFNWWPAVFRATFTLPCTCFVLSLLSFQVLALTLPLEVSFLPLFLGTSGCIFLLQMLFHGNLSVSSCSDESACPEYWTNVVVFPNKTRDVGWWHFFWTLRRRVVIDLGFALNPNAMSSVLKMWKYLEQMRAQLALDCCQSPSICTPLTLSPQLVRYVWITQEGVLMIDVYIWQATRGSCFASHQGRDSIASQLTTGYLDRLWECRKWKERQLHRLTCPLTAAKE